MSCSRLPWAALRRPGAPLSDVDGGFQAIAAEMTAYSNKAFDDAIRTSERLIGVRSVEQVVQIQSDYAKKAYENHMARISKLAKICVGMVEAASKPVEGNFQKVEETRPLSKPISVQIVERARGLIADEQNWCRGAQDVSGVAVSPTLDSLGSEA